jgi:hypothetical protein
MALNNEQIETLFHFTKKKFVHFYDLQVELVDHLASSIEEEMKIDPALSFEHALQKVYNRFGIFGFAKVVQEKQSALVKHNRRIWWNAVGSFFTIPKIIISITVFLLALFVGRHIDPEVRGIVVLSTWFAFSFIETAQAIRTRRRCKKPLLLTQYTSIFSLSGFMVPYWFCMVNNMNIPFETMFAVFMVIVVVFELAILQVNSTIRKKAIELYPEAFATS